MAKAIAGAAMIGLAAAALLVPGGAALVIAMGPELFFSIVGALAAGGVAMEAGAIAQALISNRGMNITTRQPASFRQIIYGEQRVGGVIIYRSTTGSSHDQYNYVIVLAAHVIDSIVNLYLDGRLVYWNPTNTSGNTTRNGVNFGGSAVYGTAIGPNGAHYNFGGRVYCEARFGDQLDGDVILGLTANDPNWASSGGKSPWVGGCAYVYLKVEYDEAMFPGEPEIRFTVRGKNNIADPRTGLTGFSSNWALVVADVLSDPVYGVGDGAAINTAQLIAAANVCDEQVACAAGLESRYALNWHYDTSVAPGDVLDQMMPAAAGRLSRIGGQWFIWPAYWQGPSFTFDANVLTDKVQWTSTRGLAALFNRVTGTYVAPNYPYNVAGNLYDSNGWYYGTIADQFPFAFQPTNYPQYGCDVLHGYASDQYLIQDGGIILPRELGQQCVLSIAQAQRLAKIYLLRNRQQGTGTMAMSLAAWGMQPCDVMMFNFPVAGWTNKLLEITATRFRVDDQGDAPRIWIEFDICETDPAVYEWSTADELTAYDVPSMPTGRSYTPAAPTGMALSSGVATAIVGADVTITTPTSSISALHFLGYGYGGVPGATGGTGAGTSPVCNTAAGSSDAGGHINVTTGTAPAGSNAVVATLNFNIAYATAPTVILTPANAAAAALTGANKPYCPLASTTGFTINAGATALAASTAYVWAYHVIG